MEETAPRTLAVAQVLLRQAVIPSLPQRMAVVVLVYKDYQVNNRALY